MTESQTDYAFAVVFALLEVVHPGDHFHEYMIETIGRRIAW
jgi:hypothetical protein